MFLISLALILIGFEAFDNNKEFHNRANKMHEDYINRKKELVKQEVLQTIDLINYKMGVDKENEQIEKKLL